MLKQREGGGQVTKSNGNAGETLARLGLGLTSAALPPLRFGEQHHRFLQTMLVESQQGHPYDFYQSGD